MNTVRKNACMVLAVCALVVGVTATAHGQGKLGRVREAVRESKPKKPRKQEPKKEEKPKRSKRDRDDHAKRKTSRDHGHQQRNRSSHRSRDRRRDRSLGLFLSSVAFSRPKPVHVVHHHVTQVDPAPVIVAAPQPAYDTVVEPTLPVHTPTPQPTTVSETYFQQWPDFDWAVRLSALGGTDFADIAHGNLGLLLQPKNGLGIDTSVTIFRESGVSVRDHLYLGDVNLTYEPVLANDRFRMRIGAGVNWLSDAYGSDAGFNMTGGLDWKLSDRWLLTGEIDFGTIGDTDLTHAQISLGRALSQQTELTFGYNYHDIGGVTIGSAFTGLRFRF